MIRMRREKKKTNKKGRSCRCVAALMLAFLACPNPVGDAEASAAQIPAAFLVSSGETGKPDGTTDSRGGGGNNTGNSGSGTGSTGSGTGTGGTGTGTGSTGTGTGDAKWSGLSISTVSLTEQSATVIISGGENVDLYYLLVKEAALDAPTAEEIKKEGIESRDGFIFMAPLPKDVEYLFYAIAEDKNGKLSEVISKRGVTEGSRGIAVMGHIYCGLQSKDTIVDYTNMIEDIALSTGDMKETAVIEYIIADKFLSSEGLIEAVATEKQDVTTADGTTSLNISKWTKYDPYMKPGLVRNMLNYIYVKITNADGTATYISSPGIWEDELPPVAESITPRTDETSAEVTVTGSDDESGIRNYYLLVRDSIELTAVEPEDVKRKGLTSLDGTFSVTGLSKRTRYDLFAVTEDKAGNLSPVKDGKMTTEGEPEASAVRQSSDTSSNPGGDSNVSKRTDGVSLEDPEVEETVIESVPYIVASPEKDYSGLNKISGWNDIGVVAEGICEPGEIFVEMNGAIVVPGDVLDKVAGRDVTYHFIMDDTCIWVINGKNVKAPSRSTDLRINRMQSGIPPALVNELAGVYPRETFSVAHRGEFEFSPVLDLRMGTENAGKNAYLYFYIQQDNRLELLQTEAVNENGYVSFSIPYEASYAVVVGKNSNGSAPEAGPSGQDRISDGNAGDFANTGKSSGYLWIVLVSVLGVLLCGFIIFGTKAKKK